MPRPLPWLAKVAAMLAAWMAAAPAICTETVFPARPIETFEDPCSCSPVPIPLHAGRHYPYLYANADALALKRDSATNVDIASLGELPMGSTIVFNTRELEFEFQAGFEATVGAVLSCCHRLEFSYLALGNWHEHAALRNTSANSLAGSGNLFSPFTGFGDPPVVGLDYNNFVSLEYRSEVGGAEANYWHHCYNPPGPFKASFGLGARYMEIDEQFIYQTESELPAPMGTTNVLDVSTANELFGPQLSGLFYINFKRCMWLEIDMRFAIMQNMAQQQTLYTVVDENGITTDFPTSKQADRTVFMGDVSFTLVYDFRPNLRMRIGYQGLFIDGLALADENAKFNQAILTLGPGKLDHDGTLVYHGPHLGATFSW